MERFLQPAPPSDWDTQGAMGTCNTSFFISGDGSFGLSDALKLRHTSSSRTEADVTLSQVLYHTTCLCVSSLIPRYCRGSSLHHTMPCLCPQSPPSSQTLIRAFRCIEAEVLSQGQTSPCLCSACHHWCTCLCPGCVGTLEKWQRGGWLPRVCYVHVHVRVNTNSI